MLSPLSHLLNDPSLQTPFPMSTYVVLMMSRRQGDRMMQSHRVGDFGGMKLSSVVTT